MKKTLLLLASLACACASASAPAAKANPRNPKPEWVDGSSMEYPRDKYLTGVGSADDRNTAGERARGEISKIFSSQITVNTASQAMESTVQVTGQKDQNSFSQSVSNSVENVSKKVLEGVEVPETWQDDASRVYYALAVLEKAKALSAITDKIADFDAQVKQWYAQMVQATDKLPRVKAGMKLLALFKARKGLENDLRVLDGKGMPNPVDEAAVRATAAKALSELDVAIDVSGTKSREVETGVVKALNGFGLQASAGAPSGPVDVLVTGEAETNPVEGTDPRWKFARSYVTVSLKDGRTNKVFLQFDVAEKGSSGDYNTAARRSLANLAKKVAAQISDGITEYFENQ
ncbi:MAG: LPP20 family lipoprotein [Elusimicrobia bacterium]|nr:LPP20 family lipoprotein [Elusimicrobiota bacterium]